MDAGECMHGRPGCTIHPEPDTLGRYRCQHCHCFTAEPSRIHPWCRDRKWPTKRRDRTG